MAGGKCEILYTNELQIQIIKTIQENRQMKRYGKFNQLLMNNFEMNSNRSINIAMITLHTVAVAVDLLI